MEDSEKVQDVATDTTSEIKMESSSTGEMTKTQKRKLEKRLKWEGKKEDRKRLRKEKRKERKEKGLPPRPSENRLERKKRKSNKMSQSSCKIGVAIDMSFNDLMLDKDMFKCGQQINRCYSVNRRLENPMQVYVTSFAGKAFDSLNAKHPDWKHWDLYFKEKSYLELEQYPKEKIIYLTSESDNVVGPTLEDDALYVIGGLVDHNHKKGLCLEKAQELSLNHARLPIDKYIAMRARRVLTINHVFELLSMISKGSTWEEALMTVIPSRNDPKPISEDTKDSDNSDS